MRTPHLPFRGHEPIAGLHPTSDRYKRNFFRAAALASVAHLLWFTGWMIYRHFNPETDERHATVVHLVEVGLPPEPKIEPPKSIAPPRATPPPTTVGAVKATPPRAAPANPVVKPAGSEGRARAKADVAEKLEATTKSVESALEDLSSALSTASDGQPEPSRPRGRRAVRSGRSGSAVGGVNTSGVGAGRADLASSAIDGSLVAIESVSALAATGGSTGQTGDPGADGTTEGKSLSRSNASLLAVVRKYAAGIQFCYENELKHQPGLQGKLVVSLTVAPSGQVTEVKIVDDTLRSTALGECATGQMRAWKFPPVEAGTVSFRAPFVFTPPKQADKMVG